MAIIGQKYVPSDALPTTISTTDMYNKGWGRQIEQTCESLSALDHKPALRFEAYSHQFGRFCVLLDEQLHFNRYRLSTLRSAFYENSASFPLQKYKLYCGKHEKECLKSGMKNPIWTNTKAEELFGESQENGDLGIRGSSGWKLTALKDFIIDVHAHYNKIRLLRLAVWDEIMIDKRLIKLNDLLLNPGEKEADYLLKFIERKVIGLYS